MKVGHADPDSAWSTLREAASEGLQVAKRKILEEQQRLDREALMRVLQEHGQSARLRLRQLEALQQMLYVWNC